MRSKQAFLFPIAGLTFLVGLVHAHHSRGNFDLDDVIELNGVVSEYTWRNPHTFVTLDVEDDAGEVEEWLLELNSIAVLTGTGWTRDTIQVGDRVTVFGNPDNDRSKKFFFSNYFVLPDGSRMVSAPNYSRGVPIQRPPPRELDTTASSADFTGIWRREGGMGGGMGMGMQVAQRLFQGRRRHLDKAFRSEARLRPWDCLSRRGARRNWTTGTYATIPGSAARRERCPA